MPRRHPPIGSSAMPGTVESIFVAASSGASIHPVARAALVAGCGIRGDRNYRDAGAHDGQITFIAAEEIDRFNVETGLGIGIGDTRRNVVTRGVALNALVGRQFRVGTAVLTGIELCEPCATLGKRLASPQVTAAKVVATFAHRAGLRARIDVGATISPGDRIDV
jgi:MOSC domain-containing protein YiiM